MFGVALWRRRLRWESGSDAPPMLLASLLRDLAGVEESRAVALSGAPLAPRRAPAPPPTLADRWSLPDWLEQHLVSELGPDAEAFCAAIAVPGPVCLRANRLLCTREQLAAALDAAGIHTRAASRAPDALVVETPQANLFGSEAWRAGWFELQDEGSQLLGLLVEPAPGETVLDLCAGAGGKSLLLAAQGARVLAFDSDRERLGRLRARARRARAEHAIEIVDSPRVAGCVLVDAPCSELGTLRRGPDARWRIDPRSLRDFPNLQRELLENAAPLATRRLVYATCTVHRAENEDLADGFERDHRELRRVATWQTLPHRDGTDGFFAAVWERAPRRPSVA
jgi:16S rRNA (cytosine967-C5)-methyltransferase